MQEKTVKEIVCIILSGLLGGQPRNLVRSLHLTPERGYDVAKHLPEEHLRNELKVTVVYMEKITGWPSVRSEDLEGLKASLM